MIWTTPVRVTDDGGWCLSEARILGTLYSDANLSNCIYNGVPDWNYEEEMFSSTNTIWWSPVKDWNFNSMNSEFDQFFESSIDSSRFIFAAIDVSEIPVLEYTVYPYNKGRPSPNEEDSEDFEPYNPSNRIRVNYKYCRASKYSHPE